MKNMYIYREREAHPRPSPLHGFPCTVGGTMPILQGKPFFCPKSVNN